MAEDTRYVCNLNVMGRYKRLILAGTPFVGAVLVEHTLKTLINQGHVTEYAPEAPIAVVTVPDIKQLVSIQGQTPNAALAPPTLTSDQRYENARKAEQLKADAALENAEKVAAKAQEKLDKAKAAAEAEAKAQEALKDIPTPPAPKKVSTVANIWDVDPAELTKIKHEKLLDLYIDTCSEYDLEPKQFNNKKELVAAMSSQFIKK